MMLCHRPPDADRPVMPQLYDIPRLKIYKLDLAQDPPPDPTTPTPLEPSGCRTRTSTSASTSAACSASPP
jgi:hypothetical protein